jgi:hypothetical protein
VAERFGLDLGLLPTDSQRVIPGRTFVEAARTQLAMLLPDHAGELPPLETLADLAALDAGRRYRDLLSNGISLRPGVQRWLSTLASSGRLVARADSARRDVEAMLSLAGLDAAFAFVRCSDDTPRQAGAASVDSAWIAVDRRLLAVGVPAANRMAIEIAGLALDAARPFAARVQRPSFQAGTSG